MKVFLGRCGWLVLLIGSATGLVAAEQVLLDAASRPAWEFVTPEKTLPLDGVCAVEVDGSLLLAGQPIGFLATKASYTNYRLHVEWRWTGKAGNSGILVHVASGPKDRAWPVCYQIQTKSKSAGDLLPMAGATFAEPIDSAAGAAAARLRLPAVAERPVGEWNEADVVCRDGTISVSINGAPANRVTGCSVAAGRIGLQFEGVPYAVRAVRLEELAP